MEIACEPGTPARRRGTFARLRDGVMFYLVLGIFCAAGLAWSLLAALLFRLLPRRAGAALGQSVIMAACRAGLGLMRLAGLARFDLTALDALPAAGPAVVACNHLSLLDAVLVLSRLPRAVCIAKAELWDNPFLGGSVRLAGYIRNDTPLALVRAAARALGDGRQLLIFPEGTRSDGQGLGRFRPGFAVMARMAGVPVQTVFLSSNTPYLRRGWALHRMPRFPLAYRARCGRRIAVTADATAAAAAIERYFAAELPRA